MTDSNTTPKEVPPKSLKDRQQARCEIARDNDREELTDWEDKFLRSCIDQMIRYDRELSHKQLLVLETIENVIENGRTNKR